MSLVGVIIEISGGNVRNHHFSLREAAFLLPPSTIGGANDADLGEKELTVEFDPGATILTDIAGDKMIFRKRAPVREFFELADIVEGDRITLEKMAPFRFRIRKLPR